MRITTHIGTSGLAGVSKFPYLKCPIEDVCTNGLFDEGKARKAIDGPCITWSSRDNRRTTSFCAEYLSQHLSVLKRMTEADETLRIYNSEDTPSETDIRVERRMKKGRFCYVRVDIEDCEDFLKVRIGWDNPKQVVGTCEEFARDYALMCARILLYLKKEMDAIGNRVELSGTDSCPRIVEEAEWMNRRDDARKIIAQQNEKRKTCKYCVGGLCSPMHPECPCYSGGRCVETKVSVEFQAFV